MRTTTCTYCQTTFRVTPEQLRAHRGDVRCGRCHRVFNAHASLNPPLDTHSPHAAAKTETETPTTTATDEELYPTPSASPEPAPPETEPTSTAGAAPEMEAAPLDPFPAAATQPAPDTPADAEKATAPAAVEDVPQVATIATLPLTHDGWPPLDALDETAALPTQRKRKPSGLWIAGILLLTLLLAGQGVYDYRTDLARDYPTLKPALQQLCALIGCDLPLPRQIDQVSIEASTLQTDPARPQLFILHATLRNRAAYVMAYPSLDLSLTDIQDKVVVRRVLSPAAYLPKTTDPAAGMAASSDAAITLYLKKTAGLHAAGYRLALFYPHELPPIRRQVIVTPP